MSQLCPNVQWVLNALTEIIEAPDYDAHLITHYFSPQYQQTVDGEHLDFSQFCAHIAALKSQTHKMTVTLLAAASHNNLVFTRHQVAVTKLDGSQSTVMVLACFELSGNKITRCYECSMVMSGPKEDKTLASIR
ncbi:nuclear transport factor 2 family protein [Vibrio sp. V39_P1S14PM300]|uniref:nuclear transport factor 2 family protein n=1 Tax=Vibrio sp. V39_P1S14PM300 TaxID=1938690 RepID=UPI00137279B8|nr:nuclear transport factor 2 family protein [Vibrio sp. V39_P1S14PM300]NAX20169.1 nuclear transport factor 2 family protein [Vibrio sp. V39_P1S14PM300]